MRKHGLVHAWLRVGRALACSLALHGALVAAILHGPSAAPSVMSPPVRIEWTEAPALRLDARVAEPVASWTAPMADWRPPDVLIGETPLPSPEQVAPPTPPPEEPLEVESSPDAPEAEAYWMQIRRDIARGLRWPAGWREPTNIDVRVHALEETVLPLEPAEETDAMRRVVRRALERAARRAEAPPAQLVGREMRFTVRFEPK